MKDNTYQYYAGNMVYKNDKSLNYLLFDEGLVTKTSSVYSYEYHLKDHPPKVGQVPPVVGQVPPKVGQGPGNTRVTFQPNGNSTTTTQVAEYYPFGSSYLPVSPAGTNKYLYNGKEKQDDVLGGVNLDWYDYGARFYDPMIGRWQSMEPYAELVPGISPYAYCYNNPVNYTEPTGKWPTPYHGIIIRWALNPYIGHGLTYGQLDEIIQGGEEIDTKYQAAEYSFMHSMRDGTSRNGKSQSIEEAQKARDAWVSQNIADFKKGGDDKYIKLGYAIHAMSDEYAPSHSWKPWYGQSKLSLSAWIHGAEEANLYTNWFVNYRISIDLVRQTYEKATAPESSNSSNTPKPDSTPDPMKPRPWQPIPIPAPTPAPIDPRQFPLPRPQPGG